MDVPARPPIVALVCSAGGLDALVRILRTVPDEFAAAVVVLRHQDPRVPGGLAQILHRRILVPVAAARDGDHLEAGRVLVAPAGHHTLVLDDDTIALIESGDRPPYRPSADLLFTSLAVTAGPRAIAVVLSGYGNDGATGATAIHRLGGVVVASDKASSKVFEMPYATISRDEIIDHVVPVDEIGPLLTKITNDMVTADSTTDRLETP